MPRSSGMILRSLTSTPSMSRLDMGPIIGSDGEESSVAINRRESARGALVLDHAVDDLIDRQGGPVADEGPDLGQVGDAAAHVFEPGLVGLVVGDVLDGGGGVGAVAHEPGEVFDRDFVVVP